MVKKFCVKKTGIEKALVMGKPRMYVSTSALLSHCTAPVKVPSVILVTLGSVEQISKKAPAATAASALGDLYGCGSFFPDLLR